MSEELKSKPTTHSEMVALYKSIHEQAIALREDLYLIIDKDMDTHEFMKYQGVVEAIDKLTPPNQ